MAKRRWKKEWIQAVASFHERILRRLQQDENVFIHNYKSLYFRIFREAYEGGFCAPLSYNFRFVPGGGQIDWIYARPLVTGDSIWKYAQEHGWVHSEMELTERRYEQIQTVQTWWDEWTYAWHELMYKARRYRTIEEPTADKPHSP